MSWPVGLALASALGLSASCLELPPEASFRVGVNLAGAEFGTEAPGYSNESPGEHGEAYLFPSKDTVRWFTDRGLRVLRLPLAWERLQPEPAGPLDPTYAQRVLEFLDLAQVYGGRVVLDLHAYGRYRMAAGGAVHELVVGILSGGSPDSGPSISPTSGSASRRRCTTTRRCWPTVS